MKKSIVILAAAAFMLCAPSVSSFAASEPSSSEISAPKPKKDIKTVTFKSNLHCANCAKKVQENIAFEKGVKDLQVSVENQTIVVTYDATKTSEEKLAAAIKKLGYKAEK